MKLLLDFLPLGLFLGALLKFGIVTATAVLMVSSLIAAGIEYYQNRKIEKMRLYTLIAILGFGALTLITRDARFIMFKTTAINWVFALVFIGVSWYRKEALCKTIFANQFSMPEPRWWQLNIAWVVFFLLGGTINLAMTMNYISAEGPLVAAVPDALAIIGEGFDCSLIAATARDLCQSAAKAQADWGYVKTFGLIGLTIIFTVIQVIFMMRFGTMQEQEEEKK